MGGFPAVRLRAEAGGSTVTSITINRTDSGQVVLVFKVSCSTTIHTPPTMDDLKSEVPEQYVFPDDAYRRMQNYALVTGFVIVIGSGSEKKGRIKYLCVHHGKSRNTKHLFENGRPSHELRTASGCAFN